MSGKRSTEVLSRTIDVFCGTWNVNGKQVKEDLTPWLIPEGGSAPDLYAIGFQEFDLTRESYVGNDEARVQKWDDAIQKAIQKVGNYVQIGRQQLVGMLIILYAKEEIESEIMDLDSDLIGTGYAGIFGNKGGVGIRFRIKNDTFCFVNAHLNAHVHNVERRNNDYRSIISRMVFSPNSSSGTNKPQTPMELPEGFETEDRETESAKEMPPIEENKELKDGEVTVFDHTHFIWMGDLNYRVDLKREEIMTHIQEQNWPALRAGDQLLREIKDGKVFQDFVEGDLAFLPTYKFDSGTNNFDSSRKMRLPAYCDRVLWKSKSQSQVRCLSYRSHMELLVSDHKPVSSILQIKLEPYATTPTKKVTLVSSGSSGSLSPKDSNGMSKSAFPRKSYFRTTSFRFIKTALKSPVTYVVLAIAIGVISYLVTKRA